MITPSRWDRTFTALMPYTALMGIGVLLVLATIFLIPLNSDSDLYQSMAVDLLRYGKLPYMGSWDQNFPGIVYLHAIAIALFGNSDAGFRMLDLFFNATSAFLLFQISRRFVSIDVAILAPFIYAVYYVSGGWWAIGQRDVFATTFLLAAAYVAIRAMDVKDKKQAINDILVGVLIGCASIIRPTYALFLPLLLLVVARWRSVVPTAIGFAVPFALFCVSFTIAGGDLSEVILAVFTYNTQAYGSIAESWSQLWERSVFQILLCVSAVIGLALRQRRSSERRSQFVLIAGAVTGLVSVLVMRKFFVYHFHVFFTFLIPFTVIVIDRALARISIVKLRPLLLLFVVAVLIGAFYPRHLPGLAIRSEGSISERVTFTHAQFSMDSSFGRAVDVRLSEYLGAEKNVELVSVTPAVHWMNELDRPSRFTMIHPLTITGPDGTLTSFQTRWRVEYLATLEARKPKIIVLADGPAFLMKYIRRSPKDLAMEIEGRNGRPGFAQLLNEQYVLDTTIGGYYIYTRNVP